VELSPLGNNVTSRHHYTYEDAFAFGCRLTRHTRYLRRCGQTKILTRTGELMEDMLAALIPPVPMWSENYAFIVKDALGASQSYV
jgi:hypothetical protein